MVYQVIPNLSPILYGFTDDKKIINLFKEQRNMKRYIIIDHEVTKDEWYKINQSNSRSIMRTRRIKTSSSHNVISSIDIIMTESEDLQLVLESDNIMEYIERPLKDIRNLRGTFNEEIINALGILWSQKIEWKDIEVDQLELFILMHEDYMKGGNNNDSFI